MNKILNYQLFLLAVLFPFLGNAQQLSLSDCFKIGKKEHIELKIQQLKVEQTKISNRSIASKFLPEIGISASHNYNFGSSINPSSNSREPSNIQSDNFSFDLRSNLVNFSKWKERDIQNLEVELEKMNTQVIELQFELLVLDKYMKALTLQEWRKTRNNQLINSETTLNRIIEEVEQGKRSKSDEYDVRVIFLQDKIDLDKIIQDEILAKTELIQLINSKELFSNSIVLSFPNEILSNYEGYTINNNPNIQSAKIKLNKNKEEQKLLKKIYLPTLDFVYSYGTFFAQKINNLSDTNFQFQNQLIDNKSQFVGLSLYIPLFSKGNNKRNENVKKLDYLILEEEQKSEIKRLTDLLEINKKQIQFYNRTNSSLVEIEVFSKKALETTTSKYIFDKVDASVYKNAKNQSLQAEYNLLVNKIQLIASNYQLELYFK